MKISRFSKMKRNIFSSKKKKILRKNSITWLEIVNKFFFKFFTENSIVFRNIKNIKLFEKIGKIIFFYKLMGFNFIFQLIFYSNSSRELNYYYFSINFINFFLLI